LDAESARRDEQRALAEKQREIERVNRQLRIADPDNLRGFLESKSRLEDMLKLEKADTLDPTTLATVGELYAKLGSFTVGLNKSIEAEQQFRQKIGASLTDQVMMATILGQIRLARGEYAEAIRSFRKAVALSAAPEMKSTAAHSWALAGLGNALLEADQFDEAEAHLKDAQSLDTRLDGEVSANVARDISLRATNYYYHGDLARAEQLFAQSIEMRRKTLPVGHVKMAEDLNALGSIYFMRQDHARAERLYSEALQSYRRFYGEDHPDTTVLKHNLGRTKLERGAFQEAMELTLAGLKASQSELVEDHEGLTFSYDSLGLAQMGLGKTVEAEQSFKRALEVANKHQPHRMQGPILVDLADLNCRTKRYADGLRLVEQSRPFIARDYADQPWRTAMADSVEGGCKIGIGEQTAGRRQAQVAYRSLRELIGSSRLFTRDAARRAGL
jgi:tetratricopeptide (TPR) repeat protein